MITPSYVVIFCWVVFIFCWILNWNNSKPTAEKRLGLWRLRILAIIVITALIAILKKLHILPKCATSGTSCYLGISNFPGMWTPSEIVGVLCTIVGLVVAITARKALADNWSSDVELKKSHKLITTGIYHYARHPIYLGIFLVGLGSVVVFQSATLFTTLIVAFVVFMKRIEKEEALMLETFPKQYAEYKKHVKKIIPYIW